MILGIFFKLKISFFGKFVGFRYIYIYIKKIFLNMCWFYVFFKLKIIYIIFEIFYKKYMLCIVIRYDGSEVNGNVVCYGNVVVNRNVICYGYVVIYGVWYVICYGKYDVIVVFICIN